MKTITFRPLRVIKKTGKITVASYSQWRSIKTADYNNFKLIVDESYKMLNDEDLVYDSKGNNLFFYDYSPSDIIVNPNKPKLDGFIPSDESVLEYLNYRKQNPYILLERGDYKTYWCKGLDVSGVPIFTNLEADNIYNSGCDMSDLHVLTVKTVKMWFGWFLYELNNSKLITK